jgi:hypothetical protein
VAQQVRQPQQAQVAAIQFAYGPGTYGLPTDLIDYEIPTGAKIQKAAIEKLGDVKHDLDFDHLFELLESLCTRAIANNWIQTLFSFLRGQAPPQVVINLLDNYGIVREAEILAKLQMYMFQNLRATQDFHNAFQCLEASLQRQD